MRWHTLAHDWYGTVVTPPLRFSLEFHSDRIVFSAERSAPPVCNLGITNGTFKEGLWESEVAELFVKEESSSRYLEVNLAPTGAWWWCVFDTYRVRAKVQPPPPRGLHTSSTVSTSGWSASIELPYAEFPINLSHPAQARLNVTGVIRAPETKYLTWVALRSEKPDFHLTDQFVSWAQPSDNTTPKR